MYAKKSLGQNFLKSNEIINQIVNLIDCDKNDLIMEIGPGRGALTRKLIGLDAQFLAIEIDKDMHEYLDKLNAKIIYEDFLSLDLDQLLKNYNYNNLFVVGNLPYYITSPILEKIIKANCNPKKMVFMVQKEVADRYTALPGNSNFGYMSLFIQYKYDAFIAIKVNRNNFIPVPKVDSSVICLDRKDYKEVVDFDKYISFLHEAFTHKRKTLKNNLSSVDFKLIKPILEKYGFDDNVRAEELNQDIMIEIYKKINDIK